MSNNERPASPEEPKRLDIGRFLDTYEFVSKYLPNDFKDRLDNFICEQVISEYPNDIIELYRALANSDNDWLRELAAARADNVSMVDEEEGARLLKQLQADPNPAIANEAHETERDLPFLLERFE